MYLPFKTFFCKICSNKKKSLVIPLLIFFIIGLAIRLYKYKTIPPGIDWDELSIAYNAFSIAKLGKDEWGIAYPAIFKAFGDYKSPIYIYLTSIIIKILGLSIFSTKLTAILSGSFSIIIIYFLTYFISKNKTVALISSIFLTFSPHSIFFSHLAQETILSNFFILLGILLELVFIRSQKQLYFALSIFYLILALFTYNLARVISPILLLIFFILNLILLKKNRSRIIQILFTLSAFFIIILQFKTGGLSRLKYTGFFGQDKGVVLEINELRDHDKNSLLSRLVHNKVTFYATTFMSNYIAHFSTDYLVNFREYNIVQESPFPPLFLVMLPFYYFGLFQLVRNIFKTNQTEEKLIGIIVLLWIIISPIPSAITEGAPSTKRYLGALGSYEILTTLGLWTFFTGIKNHFEKKVFIYSFLALYALSVIVFLFDFFKSFPKKYNHVYAYKENIICNLVRNSYSQFDYFIYSREAANQPQIYALFCLKYPPEKYIAQKKWQEKDGWFYIQSFDKFLFFDKINLDVLSKANFKGKKVALFLTTGERTNIVSSLKGKKIKEVEYGKKNSDIYKLYFLSLEL